MKLNNLNLQIIKPLLIIWTISVAIFIIAIILAISIPGFLSDYIPTCSAKEQGGFCIMCGTTRAFNEILRLNFEGAYQLNKGSIPIFLSLTLSCALFLLNYKSIISHLKN